LIPLKFKAHKVEKPEANIMQGMNQNMKMNTNMMTNPDMMMG